MASESIVVDFSERANIRLKQDNDFCTLLEQVDCSVSCVAYAEVDQQAALATNVAKSLSAATKAYVTLSKLRTSQSPLRRHSKVIADFEAFWE